MTVLFVLGGSLLLYRLLGATGVQLFATWLACARAALATMFFFTAISHFAPMRRDLIAMVPPSLPRPDVLVVITGVAELAGAAGLLYPPISAARRSVQLRGRTVTPLWLRIPMQIIFIAWAWAVR